MKLDVRVFSFNRGQVDCIQQMMFLSRYLFLFNYRTTSYYTVFLYCNCTIINENMYTGTYCQKVSNFNFKTTQSNPLTKILP